MAAPGRLRQGDCVFEASLRRRLHLKINKKTLHTLMEGNEHGSMAGGVRAGAVSQGEGPFTQTLKPHLTTGTKVEKDTVGQHSKLSLTDVARTTVRRSQL